MVNKTVLNKIISIEEYLDNNWRDSKDFSLVTGLGGLPLFYYMRYHLTGDRERYSKKIYEVVEDLFEKINNKNLGFRYSSGLAGYGYLFNFLTQKGIFGTELLEDSLLVIDEAVSGFTISNLNDFQDTDFLHGGLGTANYLMSRAKTNTEIREKTNEIFLKLADLVLKDVHETLLVKDMTDFDETTHRTNLGLAHGHLAVIIIFSEYLNNFPFNDKIFNALNSSIKCVLEFRSGTDDTLSEFPGIAVNKKFAEYNIHLGWCYGDQVVSWALYKASLYLKDKNLFEISKQIAYRTLKRDTFVKALKSPLSDAGFCHGTSSLAYMHKKWYRVTKDDRFRSLYLKFINETLEKGRNDEIGLVGYQKYMGNNEFSDAIGLLDGIIGIGIVLSDFLIDKETDWDSFFLLN